MYRHAVLYAYVYAMRYRMHKSEEYKISVKVTLNSTYKFFLFVVLHT
jgi:hypothetical protein